MSIVTHYYGVVAVLVAILMNLFIIIKADNLQKYKRFNTLFNPISGTFIGIVIFTGVVMMASKHLDFTLENIIMIGIVIIMIILEVKRSKNLRFVKDDFNSYKSFAIRMLVIEILLLLVISIWMLI